MIETLTLEEAAKVLGFKSVQPLRQKARRGEIPGFKAGNRWMFYAPDLINYIRSKYAPHTLTEQEIRDTKICRSVKRKIPLSGIRAFQSAESECRNLLGVPQEKKQNVMKLCEKRK